ncbi:hypothetical protein M4R22_08750 [Acidovorax sp. GBBC 3334]|uniref:hypothetical protein n=1 Tax=Acidovorax sp. GBBC 3334 TaxID=2940496 RepID=UPI002303522C|nr:hypothetical protein [Acidovorax sp. GBBC 3334]MDA8454850.1 hypothetical protein [Acidovorax sp. GBBC 3334]
MLGINHIKRAFGNSSSSTQGTNSTSPQRGSSHRPAHGMPPSRPAGAAAGQIGRPRAELDALRAANISTSPALPWRVASQLYDPGVINAERAKVMNRMVDDMPINNHAFVLDNAEIQETIEMEMAERADAKNMPREHIALMLDSSPALGREFARLKNILADQGAGFRYRTAELVHIASTNLTFRGQSEAQAPAHEAPARRISPQGRPSHSPRAEGGASASHSPARGSSHRPANAHGMSAPRNEPGGRRAEGHVRPPMADMRAERGGRSTMDWSVAKQLYDPLVLSAEALAIQVDMFAQGNRAPVRQTGEEVDRQIGSRLRAKANAHAYTHEQVAQQLSANPRLNAEYEALRDKAANIPGRISFDAFELLHIATANLAARAEDGYTPPPRREQARRAPAQPRPSAPPLGGEGRAAQRPQASARPVQDPAFFHSMTMGQIPGPTEGR